MKHSICIMCFKKARPDEPIPREGPLMRGAAKYFGELAERIARGGQLVRDREYGGIEMINEAIREIRKITPVCCRCGGPNFFGLVDCTVPVYCTPDTCHMQKLERYPR